MAWLVSGYRSPQNGQKVAKSFGCPRIFELILVTSTKTFSGPKIGVTN
ncbi:hypothetical protein [Ferrovibrio sp.]